MANEKKLAELQAMKSELDALRDLPYPPKDSPERKAHADELRRLMELSWKLEKEAYFSLELPSELKLEGLSLKELFALEEHIRGRELKAIHDPIEDPAQDELRIAREKALRKQLQAVGREIAIVRKREFNPQPGEAPGYEERGYSASPGFVKSNPENNDFYVEQFKDDPWYPAISQAHERLSSLIPGYNIAQIKEKFGGLRYYFDYPEEYPANPENYSWRTPEELRKSADAVITWAEGWVDGYEHARREAREATKNESEGASTDD